MTTGVLLRMLQMGEGNLDGISHIFVDEVSSMNSSLMGFFLSLPVIARLFALLAEIDIVVSLI